MRQGKRCLILGGTGFLGVNLYQALRKSGYDVIIYHYRIESEKELNESFPDMIFERGNFQIEENWDQILDGIDVVFHLISTTNPSNINVLYDFESNVLPTIRFLDVCARKKIRVIYFSSGGTVYGTPRYVPIDEEHRTEPISSYGIQKLTIEKCIEYYGRTYGLDYLILRIANPYGIGQNPLSNQGVIAVFLARVLLRQSIEIWGDGQAVRDYIYVNDVMMACIKLLDYNGAVRVFNVGSGEGKSLNSIVKIIGKQTGLKPMVHYCASRIQDVPVNVLDNTVIKKELNWSPVVSMDEGINFMVNSWDKERFVYRWNKIK